MMRFKLCYQIPPETENYIAPQLLSRDTPSYNWNATENLILKYEYDFMPKGIVTRFITDPRAVAVNPRIARAQTAISLRCQCRNLQRSR